MIDASHVWHCGCDRDVVTLVSGHVCRRSLYWVVRTREGHVKIVFVGAVV